MCVNNEYRVFRKIIYFVFTDHIKINFNFLKIIYRPKIIDYYYLQLQIHDKTV